MDALMDVLERGTRVPTQLPASLPHVLLSAYACKPNVGSEGGVGWNWVRYMSRHCRVSVLVRPLNRQLIEATLRDHPLPNITFHYLDVPKPFRRLRPLHYPHYVAWQWAAWRYAEQLLASDPFALAHHVTFASIHMPVFLQRLPVPLVFGPVAGGETGSPVFWGGGSRALLYEVLRAARMRSLRWDPWVQQTLGKAARILATTPETAAYVPQQYAAKTTVMLTVGIETPGTDEVRNNGVPGCRIYTAGRLLHWKGFHLAIQAFATVAARHPDATFTILGDGPQRPALEALIAKTGLGERIKLERWLPRDDVLKLAANSDIFLFPSLHDSGGMAVLEAMAAAKPVVCLDAGGPGVMITPACGIKVAPTMPHQVVADLAAALDRLITDQALRQELGQGARRRVAEAFTWERKAMHMAEVYAAVLGKPVPEQQGQQAGT